MPAGGQLLIETANVTLDDAYVAGNPDAVAGAYVKISVTELGASAFRRSSWPRCSIRSSPPRKWAREPASA